MWGGLQLFGKPSSFSRSLWFIKSCMVFAWHSLMYLPWRGINNSDWLVLLLEGCALGGPRVSIYLFLPWLLSAEPLSPLRG
jgi:hypothetical protein